MKKIAKEIDEARRESEALTVPIEPTEEERLAGWNTESLTAYVAERNAAASLQIDVRSMYRRFNGHNKYEQNHKYRPHRWRNT